MAKKIASVKETLTSATAVRAVWEATPEFKIGGISLTDFIALHEVTSALATEYEKKDVELTGTKAGRDDKARELSHLVTRFRSGMRCAYGPDSAQYQQAGGTRDRDRKPRKVTPNAVSA
jgi:hypothetical protein